MIFGVFVESEPGSPGRDARFKLNHHEAFVLLAIYEHGRGKEHRRRITRVEFEDRVSSYGIDPASPDFRRAFLSLRRKHALGRGTVKKLELTTHGAIAAYAIKRNSDSFRVDHALPTIEALAATLRYAGQHELYLNSNVTGGVPSHGVDTEAPNALGTLFPEFSSLFSEGILPEDVPVSVYLGSVEVLLGHGLLFMYDGHLYCIGPGYESDYDESYA